MKILARGLFAVLAGAAMLPSVARTEEPGTMTLNPPDPSALSIDTPTPTVSGSSDNAAVAPSPTPAASPSPAATPAESSMQQADGEAAQPASPQTNVLPTPDLLPAQSEPGAEGAMPKTDAPASDAAMTDPNALIPSEAPAPEIPPAPPTASSPEEKERKEKIRYTEVRIEADKDKQVKAMWDKSTKAKTDEDKRAALREYYRLLFKKMRSIDKAIAGRCDMMEGAYVSRLAQTRLEPTIPLHPPPTPEPITP